MTTSEITLSDSSRTPLLSVAFHGPPARPQPKEPARVSSFNPTFLKDGFACRTFLFELRFFSNFFWEEFRSILTRYNMGSDRYYDFVRDFLDFRPDPPEIPPEHFVEFSTFPHFSDSKIRYHNFIFCFSKSTRQCGHFPLPNRFPELGEFQT